jgi:hypothetical protein
MNVLAQSSSSRPGRVVLIGVGALFALGLGLGVVLWAKVGTAVFLDMIAAGIAYCF